MTQESIGETGANAGDTASGPTPQNPFHHWPHAAEHARRHFDPEQIEQHAVRILARGVRTQRLIAFVGAGTSMAYGRLTWADMMDRLHETLSSLGNKLPLWQNVDKRLWEQSLQKFRTGGSLPLKAQIVDECLSEWEHRQTGGMERPLHSVAADLLADHRGFLRIWLRTLVGHRKRITDVRGKRVNIDEMIYLEVEGAIARFEKMKGAPHVAAAYQKEVAPGFDGVISATELARKGLEIRSKKDLPIQNVLHGLRKYLDLAVHALDQQPTCRTSPLRNLIADWGIRRFITTNYDEEIQRALKTLEFDTDGEPQGTRRKIEDLLSGTSRTGALGQSFPIKYEKPANHRNEAETLVFGAKTTGAALTFALDGSRRHAKVLHLHGKASEPDGLIITEHDYQALYLADHRQRDLVNNATLANFAANPMLFVGSDVSEDDVLRPLRRFLTGPWHRSDRMSVAVFPALDDQAALARKKAELLVRFRVHAIHAGRINVLSPAKEEEEKKAEANWLYQLFKANASLKQMIAAGESEIRKPENDQDYLKLDFSKNRKEFKDAIVALRGKSGRLKVKDIEGIKIEEPECGQFDLDNLTKFLEQQTELAEKLDRVIRQPDTGSPEGLQRSVQARLEQQIFDLWTNRAISLFVSAKLVALNRDVQDLIARDSKLPAVFHKDLEQHYLAKPVIEPVDRRDFTLMAHARHAICLEGSVVADRFLEPKGVDPDKSNQEQLLKAVKGRKSFANHRGRRVLVICATRGAGKGALSDRLLPVVARPRFSGLDPKAADQPASASPFLHDLLAAMNPGENAPQAITVMHVNLSFSDEMSALVAHVADAMLLSRQGPEDVRYSKDPLERLERGLVALDRTGPKAHRFVLILGNAGVLFDGKGEPKNGFIQRVLRMLQSRRFGRVPLDIVMFLGEAQVPAQLRIQDRPMELEVDLGPAIYQPASTWPISTPPTTRRIVDRHLRRRLIRLNIAQQAEGGSSVLVHAMDKTRVEHLAEAYFTSLHESLARDPDRKECARWPGREEIYQNLYYETCGSRLAQTLILACLETQVGNSSACSREAAHELLTRLRGSPGNSPVEAVIEVVLDAWAARFALLKKHPEGSLKAAQEKRRELPADEHWQTGSIFWNLAMEVLWHLSALSQPVEATVLAACPRVLHALGPQFKAIGLNHRPSPADPDTAHCISVTLEWLVHWCLVFRIHPRSLPMNGSAPGQESGSVPFDETERPERMRYTVHRHIQRHFLRLMGGRNVEATYWDQFATTLYASQPDELPTLRPEAHRTLMDTLDALTDYPNPNCQVHKETTVRNMLLDAQRIRSAYFLVRSTYSLGVVAHLSEAHSVAGSAGGHMEQYRRRVRWILHAAVYWEERHQSVRKTHWAKPGWLLEEMKRGREDKDRPSETERREMGVFYPGELVWLYNECGVISLAQGKLHDAEQALTLAERAARRIEADDSGSLHTRIKLHSALTQIERGRPHQARRVLTPISERKGGHKVPPLVATFYLGLLEHIGGNYALADQHYQHALKGLREQERSRAAAFVLMNCADLARVLDGGQVERALTIADSAISLAQQGGHEDLRHLAHLARVRLHVQARRFQGLHLFEELDAAQRYATLLDMPRIACEVHELRARLLYRQGEYRVSAEEATASLEIAALYDLKLMKARGLLTLAKIYRRRGETAGAHSLVQTGKEIAASADYFTCVRGFTKLELSLHQPADDIWAGDRPDRRS